MACGYRFLHGDNMDDGEFAIALKGIDFRERWRSTSMEELFLVTSATMPQDRPGRLDDEMYADILAYVLQENRTEPGTEELPPDPQALLAMAPPDWARPWGGGLAPDVVLPPAPSRSNPLDRIRPVTDAMLYDPDDGDWLLWRRTYDASGYSPLTQINTGNVEELRVAWTWSVAPGCGLRLRKLWRAGVPSRGPDHRRLAEAVGSGLSRSRSAA